MLEMTMMMNEKKKPRQFASALSAAPPLVVVAVDIEPSLIGRLSQE